MSNSSQKEKTLMVEELIEKHKGKKILELIEIIENQEKKIKELNRLLAMKNGFNHPKWHEQDFILR